MVGEEVVVGTLFDEEVVGGTKVSVTSGNGGSETIESTGVGAREGGMRPSAMVDSIISDITRNIEYLVLLQGTR